MIIPQRCAILDVYDTLLMHRSTAFEMTTSADAADRPPYFPDIRSVASSNNYILTRDNAVGVVRRLHEMCKGWLFYAVDAAIDPDATPARMMLSAFGFPNADAEHVIAVSEPKKGIEMKVVFIFFLRRRLTFFLPQAALNKIPNFARAFSMSASLVGHEKYTVYVVDDSETAAESYLSSAAFGGEDVRIVNFSTY